MHSSINYGAEPSFVKTVNRRQGTVNLHTYRVKLWFIEGMHERNIKREEKIYINIKIGPRRMYKTS